MLSCGLLLNAFSRHCSPVTTERLLPNSIRIKDGRFARSLDLRAVRPYFIPLLVRPLTAAMSQELLCILMHETTRRSGLSGAARSLIRYARKTQSPIESHICKAI